MDKPSQACDAYTFFYHLDFCPAIPPKKVKLPKALDLSSTAVGSSMSNLTNAIDEANDVLRPAAEHNGGKFSRNHELPKEKTANQAKTLKLAESVVAHKLATFLAVQHQEQNQVLPFYSLPLELLVTILEISLQRAPVNDEDFVSRLVELQRMAHVSHHWRTVIESTPPLWSTIASNDPRQLVDKALGKSSTSPLKVYLGPPWLGDLEESYEANYKFMQKLSKHSNRWLEANITIPELSFINILPKRPAPIIEALYLEIDPYVYNERDVDIKCFSIFRGKAPRLRHISLENAPLEWAKSTGMLSGLHSLKMSRISDSHISFDQIVGILRRNPNLKILDLDLELYDVEEEDMEITAPISLHCLTELALDLPSTVSTSLLAAIEAPVCTSFNTQSPVTFEVVQPFLTQVQTKVPGDQSAIILEIRPGHQSAISMIQRQPATSPLLRATLETYEDLVKVAEWVNSRSEELSDAEQEFPACHCVISGDVDVVDTTTLLEMLSRMDIVEGLSITETKDAHGWLAYFSMPLTFDDGCSGWPYPALRALSIRGEKVEGEDVLEMVRGRYGLTRRGKVSNHKEDTPAPFGRLDFEGFEGDVERESWLAVAAIVGDEVLI